MKKLLLNLVVGLTILIIPSCGLMYWYTHNHLVFQNSLSIIQQDPSTIAILGDNIKASLFVHMRVSERRGGADASYMVYGQKAHAEAKVSAYLEHDQWKFRWVWLKLQNGKYHTVVDNRDKK